MQANQAPEGRYRVPYRMQKRREANQALDVLVPVSIQTGKTNTAAKAMNQVPEGGGKGVTSTIHKGQNKDGYGSKQGTRGGDVRYRTRGNQRKLRK